MERRDPTGVRPAFLFLGAAGCAVLGINPIFGALLAGIIAARGDFGTDDVQAEGRSLHAWDALRRFGLAFFVPVYFVLVGMRLDLLVQLDPVFFLWFVLLACAVKGGSVWLAAVASGETRAMSTRLAVALNARGTPGVLLASVTLSAGIINADFFAALVLFAVVTCQIAGFLLDRSFRGGRPPAEVRGEGAGPERGDRATLAPGASEGQ